MQGVLLISPDVLCSATHRGAPAPDIHADKNISAMEIECNMYTGQALWGNMYSDDKLNVTFRSHSGKSLLTPRTGVGCGGVEGELLEGRGVGGWLMRFGWCNGGGSGGRYGGSPVADLVRPHSPLVAVAGPQYP